MRIFNILAVFLLLFTFGALADRVYSTLSVTDGLSDNVVRSVAKGRYGFLWFGTNDGLSRYDGNEFVNYRYEVGKPHSLAASSIQTLLVDSTGRLWIGSAKGLSLYIRRSDHFDNYFLNEQDSAITAQVKQLVEDTNGDIWIGSTNGLWKYLSKQDKLIKVPLAQSASASLNGIITTLLIDQNRLWIGTYDGLWYGHMSADPLLAHRVPVFEGPVNHLTINKGVLLVSTMRHGLVCIDLNQLVSLGCMANDPLNNSEVVFSAVESVVDQGEKVIFSVMNKGLYQLVTDQSAQRLLESHLIFAIYQDDQGIIWLATDNGVLYIPANAVHFKSVLGRDRNGPSNPVAVSFYLDDEVGLLGTSKGFVPFKMLEEQQHLWRFPQNIRASQVFRSADGTYWLGSTKGLLRKNDAGMQLLFSDKKDFLWGSAFAEDQNHLWIGTQAAGLIKLDKKTLQYHRVEYVSEQNVVISLYRDSKKRIWIGSYSGGLSRYDPADNSFVSYVHDNNDANSISSNTVKGIYEDANGKIWLTTWHGLEQFDSQTQIFRHFTQKDGLPSDTLFNLLVDDFDNLWITSAKGIFKFNINSFAVEVYDTADGVPIDGNFSLGAASKDARSGEMYFGGLGAIYFHPDNLQKNQTPPTTLITKARLNGKDISYNSERLDKPVYAATTVTIDYPFAQLDFEFAALDFLDPKRNQYQYRLEGWQDEWQSTGAKRRFASYSNLWPGEYIFRVKGSNKDLLWDPKGAVLKVIINPPWWLTWWAYVLYVVLVVGAVYGLVQWRTNVIKQEAAHLENEVKLRTAPIAELLEQKERLFTHISHEFRTPLSLILRTVKYFKQRNSTTEELALINSAQSNTYRLLRMVEQLLELARFKFRAEV
ncbi:MAG: hypothetical protein HRT35_15615, partial [Algicola sp.]|nr:hypothetical protein [Algicola sp.]